MGLAREMVGLALWHGASHCEEKTAPWGSLYKCGFWPPSLEILTGNLEWGPGNCIFLYIPADDFDAGGPWSPREECCPRGCKV